MKLLTNRGTRLIRFGRTCLISLVGVTAIALVSFQPATAFARGPGGGGGHGGGFGGHGGGFGGHGGSFGGHGGSFGGHGGSFSHGGGGWGHHGGGYYGGHYGHGWRGYGWGGSGSWYGAYPYYPYSYGSYYPSYDLNDYSGYSTPYDSGYGGYLNNDFTVTPAPAYGPPATAGQNRAPTTATVEVRVPESQANVTFDGHETMTRGTERTYQTPALTPGKKYVYDVTATWTENGRLIKQDRKVYVAAGSLAVIDFAGAAPAATSSATKAPTTASK
jgi:uncharacterized protein (TIGR03000 family)